MAQRDKPPTAIIRKTAKGLSPVSAYDSELLMADPVGTEYDIAKRSRRSLPQLRLYWALLRNVVRATQKWPNEQYLHEDLKMICGYRRQFIDWENGSVGSIVDSIAFDKMNADEFRQYFDMAVAKLNDHLGWDVMSFMETA